jgi:NAD(P)-dependent dehydrogenase (short-subunit alcohol dehydrogenase family)
MKEFRGKVAVITGAASGIGYGVAERCVREGMKVVLADIDEGALAQAERPLRAGGATTLAVRTDVAKASDVEALAHKALETFGEVHLLFNNAGVAVGTTVWESTLADWQWVLGANLWGVIHGVRVFVPLMLAQETECHIINTASIAGLISGAGLGIYKVTKHGVVTLSETLYSELAQRGAKVKVPVLCPGYVKTHIGNSERIRPVEYQNDPPAPPLSPEEEEAAWAELAATANVMPVEPVVDDVFAAIRNDQLYILTHPESKDWIWARTEDIVNERNPAVE